ncbi:pancreatic lipase-related protein 3-like [Arctopsyche grandis]|uniref:pancreatic lipase-related protein 3-like n=1 Tax=Arctopsyche grandis TaxID=121162 RepID=UPI00406DA07D
MKLLYLTLTAILATSFVSVGTVIPDFLSSLTTSNFDKSKPVKIIVHGWKDDGGGGVCSLITEMSYPIPWLIDLGSNVNNFHIMGHSLGGHITGIASRSVTKGKITYITVTFKPYSFDPASPFFGNGSQRIRPGDANYVEIIHTNAGNVGLEDPVGDNDFYPNGGETQPGCGIFDVSCSHGRSYQYFAYSLDNQRFMANQCKTLTEIHENKCSNLSKLYMGGASVKPKVGLFILETNGYPPYYKG